MPSGSTWVLEMTEPWGWDEWLSAIGLTFAALALIIGTAGLAAPGVIAGAGTIVAGLAITSAGFSIAGTLMSLKESSDLGVLTDKELNRAILSIAGDIASALTAGLGTVVRAAGQAGRVANFAAQSTRVWFAIRTAHKVAQVGSLATNVAQAMTATYDFINAFKALQSQPGLSDEERDAALQRLIMTGLMTGALMTIAIRGDVKDTMKLTLHTGADGKLVAMPDVEVPHGKPGAPDAPHAKPGTPDADAAARTAGGDLGFAPTPVKPGKVPVVENPELKQEAGIRLHRGQDGAVDGMSVEYRPGARQEMIDLHLDVVNKFTGIRGRITSLLERLRAMFKGTNVPPLHLQMELYKHRLAASRIAEGFKTGKFLTKAEANAAVAELDNINRQIDDLELTIKDAASPARYDPSMVGIQQKPVGRPDLPDPPPGHTYYVRPDGVVDIRRLPGSMAPALRLEYGADGKPTGRFSNQTALEASGVLGAKLTPRTKKILAGLGYTVDFARQDQPPTRPCRSRRHAAADDRRRPDQGPDRDGEPCRSAEAAPNRHGRQIRGQARPEVRHLEGGGRGCRQKGCAAGRRP